MNREELINKFTKETGETKIYINDGIFNYGYVIWLEEFIINSVSSNEVLTLSTNEDKEKKCHRKKLFRHCPFVINNDSCNGCPDWY